MEIRINKFLSEQGICSRREADRLLCDGRILINGNTANPGDKVTGNESIIIDGKAITISKVKPIVIALYKPLGIVSSTVSSKHEGTSVVEYINYPERVYPIGRLDKNSTGLLLLTNIGELSNNIQKAAGNHEKEYVVKVNKPITDEFILSMSSGVAILDTVTNPCKVTKIGKQTFKIILTQGLNRQIRRMCQALGYKVSSLKRIRIMNIVLGDLEYGKYRELSEDEINELLDLTHINQKP